MFLSCSSLTSLDLSNFITTKTTDFGAMFRYCSGLTRLYLNNFTFTVANNYGYMFSSMKSSGVTIYVKDATARTWILNNSNGRPSTWSTSNVVIAS